MKLKINKACDLSSISVLPPHSRRLSGAEAPGLGKSQASQLRSQSQQSFSQGMSLSQLSQSSFEENLGNDMRFGSQERDNSAKRMSSLAPIASVREESQLQLSRVSNNALRRWNSSSFGDNRCQVSDELENKLRQMESSLSRLGMIVDSVQSDIMQVNRAVKEVSIETEGIRQKMIVLDTAMQQMLKGEEDIKAFLDRSLKFIPDQMGKEFDCKKLDDIVSAVTLLPEQFEARLLKLQDEIYRVFTKEMEVIASSIKSISSNPPDAILSNVGRGCTATQRSQKSQIPKIETPVGPLADQTIWASVLKTEAEFPKVLQPKLAGSKQVLQPKLTGSKQTLQPKLTGSKQALQPKLTGSKPRMTLRQEEAPFRWKGQQIRINIESDEESDADVSCLFLKKETGRESNLAEEVSEETMRILRRARKRKRRQNNTVILV